MDRARRADGDRGVFLDPTLLAIGFALLHDWSDVRAIAAPRK